MATEGLRVLLIRHAESRNNALKTRCGTSSEAWQKHREADPALTKKGIQQAEALGRFLSGEVWTDLFEVGGLYNFSEGGRAGSGLTLPGMQEYLPTCQVPDDMPKEGWCQHPGVESLFDAQVRARGIAERLRLMASGQDELVGTVTLLAHHDLLNLLLQDLLHEPNKVFSHSNAAMSYIHINEAGHARALFLGMTCHLQQELIPRVDAGGNVHSVVLFRERGQQLRRRLNGPCGSQHVRRRSRHHRASCALNCRRGREQLVDQCLSAAVPVEDNSLALSRVLAPLQKKLHATTLVARRATARPDLGWTRKFCARHGHMQRHVAACE
eukprot:TRINITY_DN20681_c0_g2_i2.p1 TRINITY_DN20681_c0_g2~~TRINITY_DN20681_c0_g2_i2.p1  ORF type:complete len:334 (+),score=54.60 TRINITY_DN20681_c0_g2_i2:25-1002(+)